MPTLLDDPPGTPTEQATGKASDGAASEPAATAADQRQCANCGAPLQEGQEWCLQCGTATPGSLDGGRQSWRSLGIVLGVLALLIAGAATAAYAALNSHPGKGRRFVRVEQTPPATVTPANPSPTTPPPVTPPPKIGAPTTIAPAPAVPAPATPPKIPFATRIPKPAAPSTPAPSTPSSGSTTTPSTPKETAPAPTATTPAPPAALLLDTNAASTYNPNGYPASWFGDPSLTIDGDHSTAWTAQVNPATAPRMAEGVAIDLRSTHRLSTLELITSTPGLTVRVYGANTSSLPSSISSPSWVALSGPKTATNRHTQIKLGSSTTAFRFVTLWITAAPAASVGTAQAPGSVDVNEIELFPAK
jgi:hypothetical protein